MDHSTNAKIVKCKWFFTVKYYPYDTMAHHKARIVSRGFTQAHDIVLKNSRHILISRGINLD